MRPTNAAFETDYRTRHAHRMYCDGHAGSTARQAAHDHAEAMPSSFAGHNSVMKHWQANLVGHRRCVLHRVEGKLSRLGSALHRSSRTFGAIASAQQHAPLQTAWCFNSNDSRCSSVQALQNQWSVVTGARCYRRYTAPVCREMLISPDQNVKMYLPHTRVHQLTDSRFTGAAGHGEHHGRGLLLLRCLQLGRSVASATGASKYGGLKFLLQFIAKPCARFEGCSPPRCSARLVETSSSHACSSSDGV